MTSEITLIAAFITGLLGSVHCIGMCGGIIGSLSMSLSKSINQHFLKRSLYLLLYNSGRIISYATGGALMGWIGYLLGNIFTHQAIIVGGWVSGIFMILLGLYIAGWWQALIKLEKIGGYFWRLIQPLSKDLLPVTHPTQAFGLGLLWGWLPCGMVYSMLAFALSSQSSLQGAAIMVAFGLGTLPMLLLMGSAAKSLNSIVKLPIVRQLAGSVIILFGLYSLTATDHRHHHARLNQAEVTIYIS